MKIIIGIAGMLTLTSCSGSDWHCKTQGKTMFSISSSGEIGSARKACSCGEIRAFERRTFGDIDEAALKSDFGC